MPRSFTGSSPNRFTTGGNNDKSHDKEGKPAKDSPFSSELRLESLVHRPHATTRLLFFPYKGPMRDLTLSPLARTTLQQTHAARGSIHGHDTRISAEHFCSVAAMIDEIASKFEQQPNNRSYVLFSHSMDATHVRSCPVTLQRQFPHPSHLLVSGLASPGHHQHGHIIHLLPNNQFIQETGRKLAGNWMGWVADLAMFSKMLN